MKPRLAIVTPAYMPAEAFGGPVRAIAAISRVLKDNGCSVRVFTTDVMDPALPKSVHRPASFDTIQGIPVERLHPISFIAGYWITIALFWRLMRGSYDIIYAHCARSFQLDIATLVAFLRRKELIVAPHGSIYSYEVLDSSSTRSLYLIHNAILKLVFRQASKIVASSQEEVRQISRFMGNAKKIVLIPNFIEESEFSQLPKAGNFRHRHGLDRNAKIILFVGRLNRIKGVDIVIRAFAGLIKSLDDVWLVLVGPDGGELEIISDMIKWTRCDNRIIITGALYGSEKIEAFVDSDIVVMPSLYESFGIVALEAFACGKPVVGSRVGGLQELIIPKRTGLQFEPGNHEELCMILKSLLGMPDFLKSMGANGREYVLKEFSNRVVGQQIIGVCEEVMRAHPLGATN